MRGALGALFLLAGLLLPLDASAAPAGVDEAIADQRLPEAERLLRAHLVAEPEDYLARFQLARVLSWQQRYAEALAEYDALLADSPEDGDLLAGKARVLLWADRPAEALPPLAALRRLQPHDPDGYRLGVQAFDRAGRHEEAEGLRRLAIARFPELSWPALERRGPAVEAGAHLESLTNGFAPWRTYYVQASQRLADRQSLYGAWRMTDRFSLQDQTIELGATRPLSETLTAQLEASYSPTHQVVAHWSGLGQVWWRLPAGFAAGAGVRWTQFTLAGNARETLTLEKYWGPFRLAYALSATQLPAAPLAWGHQAAVTFEHGEGSRVGLIAAISRDLEFVRPERLLSTEVKAMSLLGRQALGPEWGLAYEASWVEQGAIYTRTGLRLGLERLF